MDNPIDNLDAIMYLLAIICIISLQWALDRKDRS